MSGLRVELPVLYCPGVGEWCGWQLVNYVYVQDAGAELVCLWCAQKAPAGTVAPLNPAESGAVEDEAPALDPVDAVALLVRLGATILDDR